MASGNKREPPNWTFYGYRTAARGRVVQEWFDSLSDDERDEFKDTTGYLQHLPFDRWCYPQFTHLGDGLSEVRAETADFWIRVYGMFFPEGKRYSYTFLYGGTKKARNDKIGKREAHERMRLLKSGKATTHEFEFERRPDRTSAQGKRR